MSLTQRFSQGIFWNLIGTIISRLIALTIAVFTARLLGKVGFGELGMIQSTIGFMGTFAGFGLGLTTNKYVAELLANEPDRAGRIIGLCNIAAAVLGSVMALICVLAAPWLALKTINAPHLTLELQLGAPLLLISVIFGVQTSTLAGFQAFKALAIINLWQGFATLPLSLILIYFWGIKGAVLALSFSALIGILFASRRVREECKAAGVKVGFCDVWSEHSLLWKFSLPAFLTGAMVTPVIWGANAIMVQHPKGYAELGLFSAANQFRMLIMFIPNILGMVAVPLLSEIYGQNRREYYARVININLGIVWSLALSCGFIVISLSRVLMSLFGSQFLGGHQVLAIMVCVSIMHVASSTVGQTMISSGQIWAAFLANLGWAFVLLSSATFLVSKGAKGLSLAYLFSYAFFTFCLIYYTRIKFGKLAVKFTPVLLILTATISLISFFIDYFPNYILIILSIVFSIALFKIFLKLLPDSGKDKIIQSVKEFLRYVNLTFRRSTSH